MSDFFSVYRADEAQKLLNSDSQQAFDPEAEAKTPYQQNFDTITGMGSREGASYSRANNMREALLERNQKIDALLKSDELESDFMNRHRDMSQLSHVPFPEQLREHAPLNYSSAAQELADRGYNIYTDADVEDVLNDDLRRARWAAEESLGEAGDSWGAKAGIVVGSIWASMKDPVNAAAMLVPVAGANARVGLTANFVRGGLSAAAANAAAETVIQYGFVMPYKEDINSPYEPGDAAYAIGTSALAGLVLGGTLTAGVGAWMRFTDPEKFRTRIKEAVEQFEEGTPERIHAETVADNMTRFQPKTSDEWTPSELAEIDAAYDAMPNKNLESLEEIELPDGTKRKMTVGELTDKKMKDAKLMDDIYACIMGSATSG